jgi:hypothetical protein
MRHHIQNKAKTKAPSAPKRTSSQEDDDDLYDF